MTRKTLSFLFASLGLACLAVTASALPDSFSLTPAPAGTFGGWIQNGAHPYTLLTGNCFNLMVEALTPAGVRDITYNGPALLEQFALNSAGGTSSDPVVGISRADKVGTADMLGRSSMTITLTAGVYTFGAGDNLSTQLCFYAASRAPNDYESIHATGDFRLRVSTPGAAGISPGYIVWHNTSQQMILVPPIQGHVPASITGTTGTISAQRLGSPFRMTAKLTDAYWNRILKDNRTGDVVRFITSNSYVGLNPVQVAMVDGMIDTVGTVSDQSVCNSTITITAEDITANTNNGFIRSDAVQIYISPCTSGEPGGPPQNEGFFQLTAPATATAGQSFTMEIIVHNVTIANGTGDVPYKGQIVPLVATGPGVYEFGTGILGASSFDFSIDDNAPDPSNSTQTYTQTYNKSGVIWIELLATDPAALAGATAMIGPIQIFPGAPSAILASASPAIMGPLGTSIITLSAVDLYNNGIPGKTLYVQMLTGTQSHLNLGGIEGAFFGVLTNALGQATLELHSGEISENVRLRVYAPPPTPLADVNLNVVVTLLGDANLAAYPSPVLITQRQLNIEYKLDEDSDVKLVITDLFGHEVYRRTYASGAEGGRAGFNVVKWDGRSGSGEKAAVGVYGLHLEIASRSQTTKRKTRFGVRK